ncbi:MAG: hypothetical protein BWK79_02510 [Beggiatoa sp. IS2]|nr:MAG: hypothetical protein BWK79_02510 [Beggiatoa sp. IS2]
MPHINLLPWRDTLKKEREIRFAAICGTSLACAGLVWLSVHFYIEGLISYQESRNNFLKAEIKEEENKIKEIEDLQKKKERLIDRLNVIQKLQANRPQAVHLFDELVRQAPDGVYFTKMEQKNDKITLEGIAQSDARVSSLMTNVDKSQWLREPKILIIKTDPKSSSDAKVQRSVSTFKLEVAQKSPKAEEETKTKAGDKPKPAEAPKPK